MKDQFLHIGPVPVHSYLKSAELGVSTTMSRWTEIIAEKRAYEASMEAVNEAIKEGEDE